MESVIAYFAREDGDYERYEMQRIDFNEAKARFPKEWSLEVPSGGKIHDKVMPRVDIMEQAEKDASAPLVSPPILKRQPVSPARHG